MSTGVALPRLHVVSDDRVLATDGWLRMAAAVLEAGRAALALHLRGPRTTGARLFELAEALLPEAGQRGSLLLMNDRVDVAMIAGAHGAHLGRRSLPLAEVRRLLGPGARIGVSLHEPDAVRAAGAEGADYAFLGTIFRTPSHPWASALGPDALALAAEAAGGLPVLAIGGVGPREVGTTRASGAYGVAVVSGVWHADDPPAAVASYIDELDAADVKLGKA